MLRRGCAAALWVWTCVCACGLACFFRDICHDGAAPAARSACAVFEAHTILVEEIQRVSRRQANADKVRTAARNFLKSYHVVFGPDSTTQKFHYLHHLSGYVSRWGHVALPSCWTLERKHKSSKRFANALLVGAAASSKWDSSVLRSVTERHLWQLSDGNAFKTEFLVNPSKVSKAMASELTKQFGAAEFLTSAAARCRYHVVQYGDRDAGQEVGLVCTTCGACGELSRLAVLRARGGLLFQGCRGARAPGTREQRRRLGRGLHPLPCRGDAKTEVFAGVSPAAWRDRAAVAGAEPEEEPAAAVDYGTAQRAGYGATLNFRSLPELVRGYGYTEDQLLELGTKVEEEDEAATEEEA